MRQLPHMGIVLGMHAHTFPDKIGARDLERAMTFRTWNERSCRLANALLGLGLAKGDRVCVLAYNCVEWLEIYAATAQGRAGRRADQFPAGRPGDPLHRRELRGRRAHRPGRADRCDRGGPRGSCRCRPANSSFSAALAAMPAIAPTRI